VLYAPDYAHNPLSSLAALHPLLLQRPLGSASARMRQRQLRRCVPRGSPHSPRSVTRHSPPSSETVTVRSKRSGPVRLPQPSPSHCENLFRVCAHRCSKHEALLRELRVRVTLSAALIVVRPVSHAPPVRPHRSATRKKYRHSLAVSLPSRNRSVARTRLLTGLWRGRGGRGGECPLAGS